VYLCVILYHILCVYFVFLCDILLPSGVINDDNTLLSKMWTNVCT